MKIVISAINIVDGGQLTILRDCTNCISKYFSTSDIILLVNNKNLISNDNIKTIEFPKSKKNWLLRLFYEWIYFYWLSLSLNPDVWISLQDITPIIRSRKQYVYCHNPSPFSEKPIHLELLDLKFYLFRRFYGYLYGFFIRRNDAVLVQQDWLRDIFIAKYSLKRVITSYPYVRQESIAVKTALPPKRFIFPSLPRVHKNMTLLGDCLEILENDKRWNGNFYLTISGDENKYAKYLKNRYAHLKTLNFIGIMTHDEMMNSYLNYDALIFPSVLETWGLPIAEAKSFQMPILVSDMPYAHETIGNYHSVRFFDPYDPLKLAQLIMDLYLGKEQFFNHQFPSPRDPFTNSWDELFKMIESDLQI